MYHEERIIEGILHYKITPDSAFQPYTDKSLTELLTVRVEEAKRKAREEEKLRIAEILGLSGVLSL